MSGYNALNRKKNMSLSSSERRQFLTELISYNERAYEIRNRFYSFLVEHNPVGYADFGIFPFIESDKPVAVDFLQLEVPNIPFDFDSKRESENTTGLYFHGPMAKDHIQMRKEILDNDFGAYGEPDKYYYPNLTTHQVEWNDRPLFLLIPDAYLDDPDGWEARVISAVQDDRMLAEKAVSTLFGSEDITGVRYEVERLQAHTSEYIRISFDKGTLLLAHREIFKTTSPHSPFLVVVSSETKEMFETSYPSTFESEARENYLGTVTG